MPTNCYLLRLRKAIATATGDDEDLFSTVLSDIVAACTQRSAKATRVPKLGTWPTYGSEEDDLFWEEFTRTLPDRIPRHKMVKFSGRLDATAMLSLHYPPDPSYGGTSLDTTCCQKSPCIFLLFSKLGVLSDKPDAALC